MGLAFEMTRLALGLADRGDIANDELIAKRIIELAKAGELNPDVLCEAVAKELVNGCRSVGSSKQNPAGTRSAAGF
jgi:hypothetical protein